jgi:hypothetical protein
MSLRALERIHKQRHDEQLHSLKTCDRKKCYESRRHAEAVRRHMTDSGLRIYKCPNNPGHYHLGRWDSK